MTRYQDIYDGEKAGREILANERLKQISDLYVEIAAVEYAMDQELFRLHQETLTNVYNTLVSKLKKLQGN